MSVLKKWSPVLIVFIAIVSMAPMDSCGAEYEELSQTRGEVKASETVAAVKETMAASKVKGVMYETEMFSILVPDGWETKDLSSEGAVAVMITKVDDLMQLGGYLAPYYTDKYPETVAAEDYSKYLIENTIEQQNGTAIGEVKMFDVTFFTTSFTANGMDQTSFAGDKNGEVVNIIMGGKDHQNNAEIKAMQESIKFK